jgi:excisionase family DNA binding protein
MADLLGYKVSSIYAFISRNELSSTLVGRSRFISVAQLNEFLSKKKSNDHIIDYTNHGIDLVNR